MKIIIVGAGRVGSSVAESLVSEANDITVIDSDPVRIADLQDRFDLRGLVGNAALPSVLEQAGAADSDMLIAVTAFDETNLVACKIAADLYNVPSRIARVRNVELQKHPKLIGEEGFRATHVIFPEQTVTDYILKLIEFPEALQVLEFGDGRASLIAIRAFAGGPLVSHPVKELRRHLPNVDSRIVAIFREEASVRVDGDTMVQPGDEVFFLADSQNIRMVMGELRRMDKPVRRVMIAGGGNIGLRVASSLDTGEGTGYARAFQRQDHRGEQTARRIAGPPAVDPCAGAERRRYRRGPVGGGRAFTTSICSSSLTNDDENNIMSALLAKRMGARRVIALINRKSYGDLMQGGQIDIAISPSYATLSALLRFVRRGDVVAAHSLRRGAAEALEIIAHGDARTSRIIGKSIDQIELPRGVTIGGLVRGDQRADGSPRHGDRSRGSPDRFRREQAADPARRAALQRRRRLLLIVVAARRKRRTCSGLRRFVRTEAADSIESTTAAPTRDVGRQDAPRRSGSRIAVSRTRFQPRRHTVWISKTATTQARRVASSFRKARRGHRRNRRPRVPDGVACADRRRSASRGPGPRRTSSTSSPVTSSRRSTICRAGG